MQASNRASASRNSPRATASSPFLNAASERRSGMAAPSGEYRSGGPTIKAPTGAAVAPATGAAVGARGARSASAAVDGVDDGGVDRDRAGLAQPLHDRSEQPLALLAQEAVPRRVFLRGQLRAVILPFPDGENDDARRT